MMRKDVVESVLKIKLMSYNGLSAEECTAYEHFKWLSWLAHSKSDCHFAINALAPIKTQYPEWKTDHPEFTHWCDISSTPWVGPQSPLSVDELLSKDPSEHITYLLDFRGDRFLGADRSGLLDALREACKKSPEWGFILADKLVEGFYRKSDLWPSILNGLPDAELKSDGWKKLLSIVAQETLYLTQPYSVALLLRSLVENNDQQVFQETLEQANQIALNLWQSIENDPADENITDWLQRAINRPAGIVVEFWLHGLSMFLKGKSGADRALPNDY